MSEAVSEYKSHKKLYLINFLVLTVLTVVEVFVPEISSWSQFTKGVALIVLATVKAVLVAFYFMHLIDESKWLRFIACLPLAAVVYAYVLCIESLYR